MVKFAIVLLGAALTVPASSQIKIFVEPAEIKDTVSDQLWIPADFSGELKSSIIKFVPAVQLVADKESANLVLRHTATERSRGESTAKRVFVGRGAAARASAELIDSCGVIVWTETAKDTSRLLAKAVGDFAKPGPSKVADRIANRLKKAMGSGRIKPCSQ